MSDTLDFSRSVHIPVEVNSENTESFHALFSGVYGARALYFKYSGEGSMNFFRFGLQPEV